LYIFGYAFSFPLLSCVIEVNKMQNLFASMICVKVHLLLVSDYALVVESCYTYLPYHLS
jgi:hypothetical protein